MNKNFLLNKYLPGTVLSYPKYGMGMRDQGSEDPGTAKNLSRNRILGSKKPPDFSTQHQTCQNLCWGVPFAKKWGGGVSSLRAPQQHTFEKLLNPI
jgi:hypothetical protein